MTTQSTIGVLHPGKMGVSIAAAASGRRIWASEGRSGDEREGRGGRTRRRRDRRGHDDEGRSDRLGLPSRGPER